MRKQEGSSGALWVLQCRALSKVNLGSARATGGAPKVGQTGSLYYRKLGPPERAEEGGFLQDTGTVGVWGTVSVVHMLWCAR